MRASLRPSSALAIAALLAACHRGVAPAAPPPPATVAPPATSAPTVTSPAAPAGGSVGLEACEGARLDVDFARLREARRAEWVRRLFLHDPRFGELAIDRLVDPFGDARAVRFCAAVLRGGAWDAVVLTHRLDEATVARALRVYSTRVDQGGPEALGVPGVDATRVRTGAVAWSAQRVRAGELLLVPAEAGRRSAALYRASTALAPALEAAVAPAGALVARLAVDEPARSLPWASELADLRRVRAELRATAAGTAELRATGEAADPAAAAAIAARLTARAEEAAGSLALQIALRGLLSSLEVRARGAEVQVHLPATAPQVDSLLALVAAAVGARLDGPLER